MSYFYLSSEQGVILVVFWDTYFSTKYKVKTLIIDFFLKGQKKGSPLWNAPYLRFKCSEKCPSGVKPSLYRAKE